jgi:hypothetical protein
MKPQDQQPTQSVHEQQSPEQSTSVDAPQASAGPPASGATSKKKRSQAQLAAERFVELSPQLATNGPSVLEVHGSGARRWFFVPADCVIGDKQTGMWLFPGMGIGVGDEPSLIVMAIGKGGDANPGAKGWKMVVYDPGKAKCVAKAVRDVKDKVPSALCMQLTPCAVGQEYILAVAPASAGR